VNGSQLYATNQAVNSIQTSVNNLSQGAVKYDTNSDGSVDYNSVTLGGGAGTAIHNVAAGSAGTDAVNVDQLNAAVADVTNIVNAGGNPFFSADGNRSTEAASSSGAHSTAMGANAKASGANSVAMGAGSSATAANSVALGANSVADRDNSVSVGSAGNERQITNVAAGTQGTDAVNLNQLNGGISQANQYTDQQIAGVQNSVNQVARGAYSGVAAATALTMIPDVDLGKTIAVGVGASTYKGYQAMALGATARITQNLKVKGGAGYSNGGTTVGVGASYQW
jgi:autotransporter adhesin